LFVEQYFVEQALIIEYDLLPDKFVESICACEQIPRR